MDPEERLSSGTGDADPRDCRAMFTPALPDEPKSHLASGETALMEPAADEITCPLERHVFREP